MTRPKCLAGAHAFFGGGFAATSMKVSAVLHFCRCGRAVHERIRSEERERKLKKPIDETGIKSSTGSGSHIMHTAEVRLGVRAGVEQELEQGMKGFVTAEEQCRADLAVHPEWRLL